MSLLLILSSKWQKKHAALASAARIAGDKRTAGARDEGGVLCFERIRTWEGGGHRLFGQPWAATSHGQRHKVKRTSNLILTGTKWGQCSFFTRTLREINKNRDCVGSVTIRVVVNTEDGYAASCTRKTSQKRGRLSSMKSLLKFKKRVYASQYKLLASKQWYLEYFNQRATWQMGLKLMFSFY